MPPVESNSPLSPQDRAKTFALLSAADPGLADRVALFLDERDDPVVRLLADQNAAQVAAQRDSGEATAKAIESVREQMRQLTLVVVAVSLVAMFLNAALVGVSVSLSDGGGTLDITPKQDHPVPHDQPTKAP